MYEKIMLFFVVLLSLLAGCCGTTAYQPLYIISEEKAPPAEVEEKNLR